MLLGAISKLEAAMRDNGLAIRESECHSALASLRDAIDETRCDLARMPGIDETLPEHGIRDFDFESIPASGAEDLRRMRDAAANIQGAAQALYSAGVFQGVAQQIIENAETIQHSCVSQEATLLRASRMAALICEIEAELINACEDQCVHLDIAAERGDRNRQSPHVLEPISVPNDVVEELSSALAECFEDGGRSGIPPRLR